MHIALLWLLWLPIAAFGAVAEHEAGKKIYVKNCSACHGDNGNTAVWARGGLNPPPRDFTTAIASEELSRERMITSVTHGRPGTAMMPFSGRLSEAEITSVVDFIRREFMHARVAPSPPPLAVTKSEQTASVVDMRANFPGGLKGYADQGKEFFNNNCFTCHGKAGLGDGPRANFNFPRPRNFTSDESRSLFNRPRLFNSIKNGKPGTVMPAWGSVLSDQQIADVGEYVFTTFIAPANDKKKH